jgi:hypothetical protein
MRQPRFLTLPKMRATATMAVEPGTVRDRGGPNLLTWRGTRLTVPESGQSRFTRPVERKCIVKPYGELG